MSNNEDINNVTIDEQKLSRIRKRIIQIENDNLQADSFATGNQDNQLDKLLTEANKQTIKKRKKFDLYSLIAAIGIALAVWIINLL